MPFLSSFPRKAVHHQLCCFSASCSLPRSGLSRKRYNFKAFPMGLDMHPALEPGKNGGLEAAGIPEVRFKHHSLCHCHTNIQNMLHCPLYSKPLSVKFNVNCCKSHHAVRGVARGGLRGLKHSPPPLGSGAVLTKRPNSRFSPWLWGWSS